MNKHAGITDKIVGSKTWKAMARKSEDIWVGSKKTIKRNNKRLNRRMEAVRDDAAATIKDTKKKYKSKLKNAKIEGKKTAIGAGVTGVGAGAVGATEYQNRKAIGLGKTASEHFDGVDKEAGRASIFKGLKGLVMKSRMGAGRVEKLKKLEATRQARDVGTTSLAAKHRTELASGNYKGMEKSLAQRQAGESKAARKTYNTSVNSMNLPNTKTLGKTPTGRFSPTPAGGSVPYAKLHPKAGTRQSVLQQQQEASTITANKVQARTSLAKKNARIEKKKALELKNKQTTGQNEILKNNKNYNFAGYKPQPRTATIPSPVVPGTGFKLPVANMTNFKKGVMGAGAGVGALGVNDLFNGGGLGGSSRGTRVINQY